MGEEKDAHDLYSDLYKKLMNDSSFASKKQKFMKIKSTAAITSFVNELLKNYNLKPNFQHRIEKNDAKSVAFRLRGNMLFHPKIKDYIEALYCYNQSIAFAENTSENLGIAYANRSAVYFEWKMYELCLGNIKLAKESNYPDKLLEKLNKREADCLEMINNVPKSTEREYSEHFLKLSHEPNPQIPFIAGCLELKDDEDFGRYIVTNKDLKAGEVVVIEKPFSNFLLEAFKHKRCHHCLMENNLSLIPCKGCTSAMFCSTKCYEAAYKSYHKYECPISDGLSKLYTKVMLLSLRTVLKAISIFNDNLDEFKLFLENFDEKNSNPFLLDWNTITPQDHYGTIHALATNQSLRTFSDMLQRSTLTAIMSNILFEYSTLENICQNDSHKDLIVELIFRHVQTAPVNMHSLMFIDYVPHKKDYDHVQHGSGSYPILSMINHSCAPNVIRCSQIDGRCAVVMNRPVKKGGQLFDNYGLHHCLETKKERQYSLENQYLFTCSCEACKFDYPLYFDLPSRTKNPVDDQTLKLLQDHHLETAIKNLPKYCEYIDKYDHDYPTAGISTAQECLLRCLQIITNVMPLSKRFN